AAQEWGKPLLEAARIADRIPDLRPNVREAFRRFAEFIDGLGSRTAELSPAQSLEEHVEGLDYESYLLAEGPEGADRWENVRELIASAAEWSEVVAPDADEEATALWRALGEAAFLC